MAWTAPRTWTAGEIVTASIMNSAVRDNLRYIKGLDGVPTIESGLTIDNTDGDERLLLPLLSTAECATTLNAEGEIAWDETTHQAKLYNGTAVKAIISEADVDDTPVNGADTVPVSSNWAYDHITDADQHPEYQKESLLTTAGDLPYATGASAWARLGIGTGGQFLKTNAGATAPEWGSGNDAILRFGNDATIPTNTTTYLMAFNGTSPNNVEGIDKTILAPRAGTLLNLYAVSSTYPTATETYTYTVRVAGEDTSITCQTADVATSANDTTHTAAVTAGQAITVKLVTSDGSATAYHCVSIEFA